MAKKQIENQSFYDEIINGNITEEQTLKELKQYPNLVNVEKDSNNLLHLAIEKEYVLLAKWLINNAQLINSTNKDGNTVVHLAVLKRNPWVPELLKLLLEKGAVINIKNKFGNTPIYSAAHNSTAEVVEFFLEKGVDVNTQDHNYCTLLHWAAKGGNIDTVKLLVERKADMYCKDKTGDTPIHMAAGWGKTKIVEFFLDQNIDVDIVGKNGVTPLHWAVQGGNIDTVKLLIERKADIEFKGKLGETPILRAAANRDAKIVKLLIENGADIMDIPAPNSFAINLLLDKAKVADLLANELSLPESVQTINLNEDSWLINRWKAILIKKGGYLQSQEAYIKNIGNHPLLPQEIREKLAEEFQKMKVEAERDYNIVQSILLSFLHDMVVTPPSKYFQSNQTINSSETVENILEGNKTQLAQLLIQEKGSKDKEQMITEALTLLKQSIQSPQIKHILQEIDDLVKEYQQPKWVGWLDSFNKLFQKNENLDQENKELREKQNMTDEKIAALDNKLEVMTGQFNKIIDWMTNHGITGNTEDNNNTIEVSGDLEGH